MFIAWWMGFDARLCLVLTCLCCNLDGSWESGAATKFLPGCWQVRSVPGCMQKRRPTLVADWLTLVQSLGNQTWNHRGYAAVRSGEGVVRAKYAFCLMSPMATVDESIPC